MLLVCEGRDAIHFVDQHAADERIRFHQLRRSYQARSIRTQQLLFPERIELPADAVAFVEEHGEDLLRLGVDCRAVSETTAVVRAIPALVARIDPKELLFGLVSELMRSGERAFGDTVDTAIATMACHGAIRAGDDLGPEECRALLSSLDGVDDFRGHCPHGRPVVYSLPISDVERRLGR